MYVYVIANMYVYVNVNVNAYVNVFVARVRVRVRVHVHVYVYVYAYVYVYMSVNPDSIGSDKDLRIGGHFLFVCVCVCVWGGGGRFLTDSKSERLQVRMSHEPWIMNPVPSLYYFSSFPSEPTPWLSYCAFGMECCQIALLSHVNADCLVIAALGTYAGLSGIVKTGACCVWINSLCPLNINVKCFFCSTPSM